MRTGYYDLARALDAAMYGEGYKTFPVDVVKNENAYEVTAEMPGVKKEDITIDFNDGVLSITAFKRHDKNQKYLIHERSFLKMSRDINFGDIKEEGITAKLDNGILTVTINLKAPEPKKTIEIE